MTSKLRPPGFFRKTDLIANLPRQGPFAPDDGMGLADGTAIPTPEGWTVMGEVNAGQKVFDHRGCICTVVEVRPPGNRAWISSQVRRSIVPGSWGQAGVDNDLRP